MGRGAGRAWGLEQMVGRISKKCKQVREEQRLIRDTGKRGENLLDIAARLHNSAGQKDHLADGEESGCGSPDYVDIGGVITGSADHGQEGSCNQPAAGQVDIFAIELIRKAGEPCDEEILQPKKFEFLGGFAAASQHPQVVEFSADRGLAEISGISKKCEVAFSEKCRKNTHNQQQQEPRREQENVCRQRGGRNHLLHQPSNGLNHAEPVGGLHPRPLQSVIEDRIFIRNEIQVRSVLHNPNADVAGIFVRQQGIEIIDGSAEDATENRDGELRRDQPPQHRGYRLVNGNSVNNAVNDEFCDPQGREG